jgi:hypothetical protein
VLVDAVRGETDAVLGRVVAFAVRGVVAPDAHRGRASDVEHAARAVVDEAVAVVVDAVEARLRGRRAALLDAGEAPVDAAPPTLGAAPAGGCPARAEVLRVVGDTVVVVVEAVAELGRRHLAVPAGGVAPLAQSALRVAGALADAHQHAAVQRGRGEESRQHARPPRKRPRGGGSKAGHGRDYTKERPVPCETDGRWVC